MVDNVAHTVSTPNGDVTVYGKDVSRYESVSEWVDAHLLHIESALMLGNIIIRNKDEIIKVVKKISS